MRHLAFLLLAISSAAVSNVTAQDLIVDGGTTNITSGVNFYVYTFVGDATSDNQLNVLNGGTLLTNSGSLSVGQSGSSNSLVISNEGMVANTSGAIGANSSSSNNSVLVTGTNSTWTNSGTLYVGYAGSSNSLVISNGATVANTAGSIGDRFTSSGNSVLVTGTGSRWTNSENLSVGFSGSSNSLVISNGATVASATGFVGLDSISSNNSVLVTGDGSLWANSSSLTIGTGSSNSLVISNGATVASATGLLGLDSISSNNSVLVTGDGSLWANSSSLYVGNDGSSNSLVISNGGSVANTFGVIGNASISSNNSVLVTGTNANGDRSTWTNSADLYVGNLGSSNSLVISNGGTVANSNGVIGNQTVSSNNSVLVTGSNSLWTNSGDLRIGNNGASNGLVISGGGKVVSSNGYIGVNNNYGPSVDSNHVLVTDVGSIWSNSAQLVVGAGPFAGGNSLVISNGGVVYGGVDLGNGDGVMIGSYASNNSVMVDGSGSRLFVTGGMMVGKGGNGWANENSLTVSGGGQVISLDNIGMTIGFSQSSNNSVLVTGTGSLLSFNDIAVGGNYEGSGTLTVSDGASIVATNFIDISYQSPGTLNVGALNGSDTAGTITASHIRVGFLSTNGSLNFNQVDSLTLTSSISGIGTINQFGSGTTILTGNNSGFTGLTTIANGMLQFGDGVTAGGAPVAGNITNNASLIFAPSSSDTYTVSGNISGSGSLTQIGSGTTILSGNNTGFNGLTTITNGMLQFGDGVTAGGAPVAGNISNNASLIFAPSGSDTYTVSGNISGSGSLTQIGSGTTILYGNNTYTGGTVITNGLLATASTNALGTGFVTVTNTGKLAPGVGDALVIAGDFAFTTGSAFVWQLLGNTNGGAGNFTPAVDLSTNNLSVDLGSTFELFFGPSVDASDAFWAPGATNSWTIFTGTSPSLGAGTNFSLDWAAGSMTNGFDLANFSLGTNATGLVLNYDAPRYLWNTNAGDWTNAANWIDNTVPGAANDAYIDNGGLALVNGDAAAANNLYVGSTNSGNNLVISNGGRVENFFGYIGFETNSSDNVAVVTGAGTTWTNAVDLYVGFQGSSNSLVISNGASVVNFDGYIGMDTTSSNNSVLVTGTGSIWGQSSDLSVGQSGSGNSLVISSGGKVTNGIATIGLGTTSSSNIVRVTGVGSVLSSGLVRVGLIGSGNSLVISNGGAVVNSVGYIGFAANSSNNSVLVTGDGSLWTNSDDLYVGYDGSGNSLVISNGGTVANGYGSIGSQASSSNNSVLVTGVGSLLTNSGDLYVGNQGSGNSMSVLDGGFVSVGADGVVGGSIGASNNILTIGGPLSQWTNRGSIYIGGASNSVTVTNGGTLSVSGYTFVAPNAAEHGNRIVVTGSGSEWTNTLNVYFGDRGSDNTLDVLDEGTVSLAENLAIAYYAEASNNTVTVSGLGSSLAIGATITVGREGSGNRVVVTNRGVVSAVGTLIGEQSNSTGNSVLVTGTDSLWTNSGAFYVGNWGSSNSLVISNGGSVANAYCYIGSEATSSNNSVMVTGSNSLWTNSSQLRVGNNGSSNSLVISNGGTVASAGGIIGDATNSSNNSVLVTGTGSKWTNSGNLTIGAGGAAGNTLTITNGGQVQARRVIVNAGALRTAVTNALGSSAVTLGGGTGAMATMALSTNLTISSLIWSSNSVMSLTPGAQELTIDGAFTSGGGGVFDFGGFTNNLTNTLITFGTNSGFNVSNFSARDNANWNFILNGNSLQAWYGANALIARTNNTIVTNTVTYPSVTFQTNGILTVTTSAQLTITSSVTVSNNGTVDVNGVLSTPAMIIPIGGTLGGSGTLSLTGGNLSVNGTLAPGNSPGTFFVSGGNLLMGTTSVWDQQIYSSSVYDQVVVTGSAILNGVMNITTFGSGGLQFGQKYNFLTASGGISGAFSSIVAPEGFRGRLLLSGNNTQANILIAPASYTQLAANRNQSNVATALNSFIPATSGDQQVVSTSLDSLTASQYNQAFNAIMPTFYQQIATIAFNNANAQNMQLVQRLWGLRVAEGGGFSMSGLADNMPLLEGQGDGKGVLDSKKDILRPGLDNHWGMFVDGNGIFAQANSGNMLPGYNSQSGGVTTGLTYKWNENVGTGIYCGYQGTYTKSGADGSGLGTGSSLIDNAVRFGVFGTYGQKDGKGLFVNALAGGGYHNFQATRVIQYAGMNRTANSAPGAGELDTMLAAGYDIKKGKFTFGPTASLQYTYLGVNSLNETGAQSLSFNSGGWNSSSMLSSVGAHAAYSWVAHKNILVVPQVNLSWQHEFMQNPYAISGNLGGTSPTFSNWSATPIRDYLYTGVGFTVEFSKRWNTSFFYNAAAGNSDLVSQNIFWSAGVKF